MAEPMQMDMQYWGTSTDTKPTNVPRNSIYFELDTCSFYYFDGSNWGEMPCKCNGEDSMNYDIIIKNTVDFITIDDPILSQFVVTKGNPLDLETKVANGDPINGVCIINVDWSVAPSTSNIRQQRIYLPLTLFHGPYHFMSFAAVIQHSDSVNNNLGTFVSLSFQYDVDTGALTHVVGSDYFISPD